MLRSNVQFARIQAHEEFDKLWRSGVMSRGRAYQWLADEFGRDEVHMAWMDCDECIRVIALVRKLLDDLRVDPKRYAKEEGPSTPSEALKEFRRRTAHLSDEGVYRSPITGFTDADYEEMEHEGWEP